MSVETAAYRIPERAEFSASAVEMGPRLLGALLSHETDRGTVTVRITELEAYMGDGNDPGSHAFRGKTKRNAAMFGPPAHLYAYFTYGMHTCANIVCSPDGSASGCLMRGAEVVEGLELARERRGAKIADRALGRGPANLVVALGITLADGGADLLAAPFTLRLPITPPDFEVGPRTGLGGPGGGVEYPWRFWIPGERSVSPYRKHPRA